MSQKILLIEDEKGYVFALETMIEEIYNKNSSLNVQVLHFPLPSLAIEYLSQKNELPIAYLCDMRIPDELEGSERLFNYVKENFSTQQFYFITGNISEHDKIVVQRTGAKIVEKTKIRKTLDQIFSNIAQSQ